MESPAPKLFSLEPTPDPEDMVYSTNPIETMNDKPGAGQKRTGSATLCTVHFHPKTYLLSGVLFTTTSPTIVAVLKRMLTLASWPPCCRSLVCRAPVSTSDGGELQLRGVEQDGVLLELCGLSRGRDGPGGRPRRPRGVPAPPRPRPRPTELWGLEVTGTSPSAARCLFFEPYCTKLIFEFW